MQVFRSFENYGLVYTPRQLHAVFSYNLNLFRPERENIRIWKKFPLLNLVKKVRLRIQNETLPRDKFLTVNQQQKSKK